VGQRRAAGRCAEYCNRYGCASAAIGRPAGLADNVIVFSGARADAVWRKGRFDLGGSSLGDLTFGVVSETQSFGGNAGGQNFGLIRVAAIDSAIRPTFLSQTPYRAFSVDLQVPGAEQLELLPSMPQASHRLPLADLLPYGAPVVYYAVAVKALLFDGRDALNGQATVAVLDTGTTGLALPEGLFDRYDQVRRATAVAAQKRSDGLRFSAGNVEVVLGALSSRDLHLSMRRGPASEYGGARFDLVTAIDADAGSIFYRAEQQSPGKPRPMVIFLGLGFLLGRRISIDAEGAVVAVSSPDPERVARVVKIG